MFKHVILSEILYGFVFIAFLFLYPALVSYSIFRGVRKCLKSWRSQKSIKGEVALVTGSGRGLGRLIAIELAKLGCHIAIVDIQGDLAEETAKFIAEQYNVKAKAYQVDVSNYEELETLQTQISTDLGSVTILVNNAAILTLSSLENPPFDEVERMIDVNFKGVVYSTQLFLPKMKELNRGHIINISSLSSLAPTNFCSIYGATKAAVRNLTSSLRIELKQQEHNILATTVMPTFLDTNEEVVQLICHFTGQKIGVQINGAVVAYHVVRAILNGHDEVTVPRVLLYIYKLAETLPVYAREKLTATISKLCMGKCPIETVPKFLNAKNE